MQQTENYKLNIIETSDSFSPEPLNANTRVVDAQFARVEAVALKVASGIYTGNGTKNRKFDLPFTPKMVYVGLGESGHIYYYIGYYYGGVALEGIPATDSATNVMVEIVDGGFRVNHNDNQSSANYRETAYRWFAIG